MRLKLFNYLIVSLVTVVVLYPALLVLGIVWQEHLQIVLDKPNNLDKSVYWFLFIIPIFFELIFLVYGRSKIHQTYMFNRKVRLLERIWHRT